MYTKSYVAQLVIITALTSAHAGCSAGSADEATDVQTASTVVPPSTVLGTIEQEDRIKRGWHMKTQATLHSDGTLDGMTELRNSRSFQGFHGALVVVLVDDQKRPLAYVPAGRWGIDACVGSCPRTRNEPWTASVPAEKWTSIASSVRGMVFYQNHDPDPWHIIFDKILQHWDSLVPRIKMLF